MKLHAAHAAQAPALRELRGITAKANKIIDVPSPLFSASTNQIYNSFSE
jgi:hypothetical protein